MGEPEGHVGVEAERISRICGSAPNLTAVSCISCIQFLHCCVMHVPLCASGEGLEPIQARKAQRTWGQWMAEQQHNGGSTTESEVC